MLDVTNDKVGTADFDHNDRGLLAGAFGYDNARQLTAGHVGGGALNIYAAKVFAGKACREVSLKKLTHLDLVKLATEACLEAKKLVEANSLIPNVPGFPR